MLSNVEDYNMPYRDMEYQSHDIYKGVEEINIYFPRLLIEPKRRQHFTIFPHYPNSHI